MCQLLLHPEETFISASTPKFGWVYNPSFNNDSQSGYEVIVASSQALANANTGDMWDSGVVSNSTSINLPYGGATLQPNTSYFWRVRTMDSTGQLSAFSAIQQFNTASHLADPVATSGVIYQQPSNNSTNCYPLRYVSVPAVLVTTNSLGHWFIDFGNDAFGFATVHINGNYSGTNVTFGLGELASNNVVNTSPGATIRYQSGNITLQNGNLIYTNRSSYTGSGWISPPTATYGIVSPFRYLELSGVPSGVTLTTNDVTQQRLQTEFDDNAATFTSSSTALNQVWSLCRYSMKALSFDGIYVDGDRERTPYEADTYIHMMSANGVYNDFTAPRCSFEYLTTHLTWPTEWPMHMLFVAWADYQATGDTYLMTKYYTFLTNSCVLFNNAGPLGLVHSTPVSGNTASGDIIDWYRISGDGIGNIDGYVPEATNAVINAFYYRCMTIMTNVAQLTGHTADVATFASRASQVYSNYNTTFWSASSQSYIDGKGTNTTHSSADANFFPLVFGLVPASKQAAVVSYINSRIVAKGAMPCGVYGAQYMLEGLFLAGDTDVALGLMTTNSTRSWMNMINIGSTLTDEAWSLLDKSNEDWNHAWGSAPGNLIPRYVLGVRPLAAGYGQILIQPQLGATLSYVQGTVPTIRGPVSVQVTNAPGNYQMSVTVPGNVTATVMLPSTNTSAVVDGSVVSGTLSNGWLTLTNIGSGQHSISATIGSLTITSQPVNVTVTAGQTAAFSVGATSPYTPLSYQWRSNSVALVNGGNFSGATTPALTISNASAAYPTNYDCIVSDSLMPTPNVVTSSVATLTVTPLPPVASFTATPTSGVEPLQVVFTDTSSNSPTSWAWDFDNNGTTDSTAQNPTNTYAAGTYSVKLIACNAGGCSTNTQIGSITVITVLQSWSNYYGVAPGNSDPFGVGMSNTNKFLAGFNPTVPGAYLYIISITVTNGTDMAITYLGANGDTNYAGGPMTRTNVLEFASGSADGSYTNNFASTGLSNILSGGIGLGTNVTVTDPFGATNNPARYYRVRVLVP
jgi:PKD repeat protein